MRRLISAAGASVVVLAAVLAVVPAVAGARPGDSVTCNGTLAPGVYGSVTVPDNGSCTLSSGTAVIHGGVTVGAGATLVLGSEDTPNVRSVINGGVHATNAAGVQIHFAVVNDGIHTEGGSGPFGTAGLNFTTIEDSVIHGGATLEGYNGYWMGFIRNTVVGTVNLNNNVLVDDDGNEYVTNTIIGSLNCAGNSPAPQAGDSEGSPNHVIGAVTGQCTAVT